MEKHNTKKYNTEKQHKKYNTKNITQKIQDKQYNTKNTIQKNTIQKLFSFVLS